MRLKSIKLAGFKSFVDPTTVNFPSNLSAVVGPNGCGKSNIIDAVRWVMGESSAKNLRGENMTDVIFNGSVNRQPVGQASIELVFDNAEGKLGGEWAAFAEIAIRRKVTREGQSEYYLNGTKCRRRDITDIFLGTGLGPRSYAIIEQGMISKLIEAKPEELRVFIEEAAGISKYKERRRETENRMRRTNENLERLTDLREELERQLSHLQRQAASAEKYTEFKKEERLLTAQLRALQWKDLNDDITERDGKIRELELEREAIVTEQVSVDAGIEKARDEYTQFNDAFNEVQARFYSIGGEIARAEQAIQHQQERARTLTEDLRNTEESLVEAKGHLSGDSEKILAWKEELAEIEPELEISGEKAEEAALNLMAAEEAMQDWQQRWDDFNTSAAEPRQKAEVQQSKIQHLELALKRLQERTEKLQLEKEGLGGGVSFDDIDMLKEQVAEAELYAEEEQAKADAASSRIAAARDQIRTTGSQLDESRSEMQRMKGRQASLEALQQAALGKDQGGLQRWVEEKGLADAPRLAEKLQVQAGWQTAVETVLAEQLQALCVDSLNQLEDKLAGFDKGAIDFVDGSGGASNAGSLLDKLERGAEWAPQLASIKTADSLNAALAMRSSLQAHESVVTPEGLWLGSNWLKVRAGENEQSGSLGRQRELEELEELLVEQQELVTRLSDKLDEARESLKTEEGGQESTQRQLREHSNQLADMKSQLSAQVARVEQANARRDAVNKELDELRTQFGLEQESLAEARMVLSEAIEAMESLSTQREALLAERDSNREKLEQTRQGARQDKDQAHQLEMRHRALQAQLDSIAQSVDRARDQVESLEARKIGLQESLNEGQEPVEELRMELELKLEQRLGVEAELSEARSKLDVVNNELRQNEQKRHGIEQRLQAIAGKLEQERVQNQGLQVSRRALQEALIESQYDLDAVLEQIPEEATEQLWKEELESLGRKIARLGAINLAAIDEYKSQSERKNYLDAQNDDLVNALETLENAIRRIDKETRSRFKETFDQVNSGLQELFPKVFGGGSASLDMTGDDLLDTGIAIMARPPGKRNSTIHLLSGGEKALTAIALVFSIFRLNPAPFCMLDEVDAPLDDANVGRYARMVKEMSEQVQFIYISHNKIAMEMADQLMGVTMHEPGVSRLVSVDLEAAAEMAAA